MSRRRQTGKRYKTPIIPYPIDDGFIAALTYGHAVDWFQNVKSVGRCTVLWHGKEYSIDKIENIDGEKAFSIYSRGYRFILKRTHTKDFVRLYYSNEEEFVATNSSHKLRSSVRATEAVMPSILSSVPISATKQVTHVPYLAIVSF